MLKIYFKYIFILAGLSLTFFIAVMVRNNLRDTYPSEDKIDLLVDEKLQNVESLDLCMDETSIAMDDQTNSQLFEDCYYAILIDDTSKEVLASKNPYKRIYPASMTKLMTAMVVCDQIEEGKISLDDEVTISKNYYLSTPGAGNCDFSPGYRISVKNLLYGLLIDSNNFYAIILAELCAGDEAEFCRMMNEKAKELGATGTNYSNSHGLDDPNHYTTPYDTYLITKAANEYEIIRDIDSLSTYSYVYYDNYNNPVEKDIESTNLFFTDKFSLPANVTMQSWKTGTTKGAGNCLSMFVQKDGKEYYVLAAAGDSKTVLYDAMVRLICLIK